MKSLPALFRCLVVVLSLACAGEAAAQTKKVTISQAAPSVVRGGTVQFKGFAVGALDQTVTWQVNGVTGGSTANGTISAAGLYTAPAAIPMDSATVTVAAVSVADPTKSATGVVLIQ